MANKKSLKDRKKKMKEYASQAGSSAEQPANSLPFEASALSSTVTTTVSAGGTSFHEVSTQQAQPQQSAVVSSPLRLVPIYDLNQLPIDWTTGDRFIPRLDRSSAALQNMRLIPIYGQNPSADGSAVPSSAAVVSGQGSAITEANGNGIATGASSQQDGVSSNLQQNADPPPNANVLVLKGNTNTELKIMLPDSLPSLVPALNKNRSGPGKTITVADNADSQLCLVSDDSVEEYPSTSREEYIIKGNKKVQMISGGGGRSFESNANGSKDESNGISEENRRDESSLQANVSTKIKDIQSSQIFSPPSAAAPASSSNISHIQNSMIMNLPSLGANRPPASPANAAAISPKVHQSVQTIEPARSEASGSGVNSEGSNNFGQQLNQFRERVWRINKVLESFSASVKKKITLSKPATTDGFPRLRKRCVLKCGRTSRTTQDCVVDVYETKLRIRSISEDNPLNVELNYSDIKEIRSKSSHHLKLTGQDNKVTYLITEDSAYGDDPIGIVSGIVSALYSAFPEVPFQSLIPVFDIRPEERYSIALGPYKKSSQCHTESSSQPDVDSVLPGFKTFSLTDFRKQFPNGDIGLLKALKYNQWFIRFNAGRNDVTPACVECIAEILENNTSLEILDFSEARLKPFSVQKLAEALSKNKASKVVEINFSNSSLSKKDVAALSAALAMPNRGFRRVVLEKTGITASLTNELLQGIRNHEPYASSLICLNLSGLKSDFLGHFRQNNSMQSIRDFLRSRNILQELNLSGGGMMLDEIVNSLAVGCTSDLRVLELSGNYYSLASSKPVPQEWKSFFSKAQSIDMIGFSNTRLPASAFRAIFDGLYENNFIAERSKGVSLDVRRNNLGIKGAQVLADVAGQMKNIRSLDVTRNDLKYGLTVIFKSYATHGGVKELLIGKNFTFLTQHRTFKRIGAKVPRILEDDSRKKEQAVEALILMIKSDKSVVTSLDLSSSNLGSDTSRIIDALRENRTITKLNISGNDMGNDGAAALASMLLSNNVLKSIAFDRNNLSISGLEKVAEVLCRNPSLNEVVLPSVDISTAQWENYEKAFELTDIFKLKTYSTSDLQTNIYCSLQKETSESCEGASSAEYTKLSHETAIPNLSLRRTENEGRPVNFTNERARDQKKKDPINHSESVNLPTSEGSSSQTTAIVHAESDSQSTGLRQENQVTDPPGETKSAPALPEKRRQRDLPSVRADALSQQKEEITSNTAFSDTREARSVISKEKSLEHTESHLGMSCLEEQRIKHADDRPTRLPPLGTENPNSAVLREMQSSVSYQRKQAMPKVLAEKQTYNEQQQKPDLEPMTSSIDSQNKAATSATYGTQSEQKTEKSFENLKQASESDNAKKSSIQDEDGNNALAVKLVAEVHGEGYSSKSGVDGEATHSAVEKGELKKAPVKPAKPSKTTGHQINASPVLTVSVTKENPEDIAAGKNSGNESQQEHRSEHGQSL